MKKGLQRIIFFTHFGSGDSNFAVFSSSLKAKNKELGLYSDCF